MRFRSIARLSRRTVVDLGASHATRAEFERVGKEGLRLVAWERARHRSDFVGDEAWQKEVGSSLAKVAGGRSRGSQDLWLGLPGHLALTKFVSVPAAAGARRARLIGFEATQAVPYPLDDVAWDYEVMAGTGQELDVLLAAVKTEGIGTLEKATGDLGWELARATPACVALQRGFRYNHPEAADCSLLVNIGARSTHLLFIEPTRYRVRTLACGGDTVTRAIAEDLRIEFLDAENVKRGELPDGAVARDEGRAAVERAAAVFAGRLALEITRTQASLGRRAAPPPPRVHLSGGGAALEALPAALAEKLQLPVERYDPLRRVEIAPSVSVAMNDGSPFAEMVGLGCIAWNLGSTDGRGPNLLTAERVATRAFRRRRPVWLAAAAGIGCVLWTAIPYLDNQTADAQRAAAEREAQLRPIREAQARAAAQEAELAVKRQQLETVRERAAARLAWVGFLHDLQARLSAVEDGWIERVSVARSGPGEGDHLAGDGAGRGLRLMLSGRLLDTGEAAQERAKQLLASLANSPFVAAVEDERFDRSLPGVLRVDFTLVAKPESAL